MSKKLEQQTDWVTDPQNELAKLEQGITLEQIQLSEKLGALKASYFIKKLVTVTTIKILAEVKESKSYKGLKIAEDGKLVTVTTFEQFCQHLGISREKVDQDILNLSTFGEDFLETSQRMGLGYRDLRKLRKLPDNAREMVINGEAVKTEDRESLLDLIEEISAKQAKDKATLEKRVTELEADNEALKNVNADTATQCAELKKELHKKQHYLKELNLDEQATQLRHELDDCVLAIDQQLRSQLKDGFEQLSQYARQTDTDHSTYMAAALVQLQRTIYRLREEFHLPDSVDDDLTPYWQRQLNGQ